MFKNVKGGAILSEFGEVLAKLRQEQHISQAELGRAIFVSGGTISNYEKGVHFPDVEKLISLANYFHVTTDYLLGRTASKLSTDVFGQILTDETTVGDLVQSLQHLPLAKRQAIIKKPLITQKQFCHELTVVIIFNGQDAKGNQGCSFFLGI